MEHLLKALNIPRRTFYYQSKHLNYKKEKDQTIAELIKKIYEKHRGKYGYLRVTIELNNMGYQINKKKVQRIMRENLLFARPKKENFALFKELLGKFAIM